MYREFIKICQMPQENLKAYLAKKLSKTYDNVVAADGFVYAQGEFPVLLVAHMDTVHKELPTVIEYDKNLNSLSSPQGIGGDDRCGIYMILEVIKHFNCSVLFCEDEEIGGVGAEKFVKTKLAETLDFNYIIEFDRKGEKDAVFYNCDNPEFEAFITDGYFKTAYGSFSDISIIAPELKCAAVNLSCGYYNAHTTDEFVVMTEMENNIHEACVILDKTTKNDRFEYIEGYSGLYDDWYMYEAFGDKGEKYYLVAYYDEDFNEEYAEIYANSRIEAIGHFCMQYSHIPYDNVIHVYEDKELN